MGSIILPFNFTSSSFKAFKTKSMAIVPISLPMGPAVPSREIGFPSSLALNEIPTGSSRLIFAKVRFKSDISFSDGKFLLDDSKLLFSASAKEFDKPNLKFDLQLDDIDLDRYLPEPVAKNKTADITTKNTSGKKDSAKKKTNYGPLRKLVLDGTVKVGKLKAHGAKVENIDVHIVAKNGIITIDPLGLDLYKGRVASKLEVNVQKNNPKTKVDLNADGIQVGPLMQDAMQKDLIEGTLKTNILLSMTGESPEMIKKTLTGKGQFLFTDGAIIGFDIANSVRNIKAKLGGSENITEKPRTDFAELKVPFTSKKGLINTGGASLVSPLIRILVTGNINLVKELLNLKIDPKFVATLKGQGDTKERSGLMIPVLVTGSFTSPKIRPDVKGMLTKGTIPLDADAIKKQVLGTKEGTDTESVKKNIENTIKNLIPGFTN
jgi:AsmA protein